MDDPILKKNLMTSCTIWMTACFNTFLITFYLKYIPGSIYVNNMYFAGSDLVGFLSAGIALRYMQISSGLKLGTIISGIGGALYLTTNNIEVLLPIIICMNRAGSTMVYNICYISVTRLFPTRYVTTVYGIVNMVAHCFACFAPLAAEIHNPYPFCLFLGLEATAFIASYFITELDKAEEDDDKKSNEEGDEQSVGKLKVKKLMSG